MALADTAVIEEFRSRLAAALDRRTEEMVDAVSSAVFSRISPYQQMARPGAVEGFRADIRALVGSFVGTIAERRPLRPLELDRLRRIGAERAQQGLSLDAVQEALEVGMATCWRFVREALLLADEGRTATALAADLAVESFSNVKEAGIALATGHAAQRGRGTYQWAQATAELVGRIVDGVWADERNAHRAAEALGVELDGSWLLLLVTDPRGVDDGNSRGKSRERSRAGNHGRITLVAMALTDSLPTALVGPFRPLPAPHLPVLLPVELGEADPPELGAATELAVEAGILLTASDPVSTWAALPVVYRLEVDAIPCARAAAGAPGVLHAGECHLFRLLREVPRGARTEYVRRVLGPLVALSPSKTVEVLATLEAYFRGRGRLDESAADLQLHRNSYRYRLERAQILLGVNFQQGRDRLRVEVALALRRLDHEEAFVASDGEGRRGAGGVGVDPQHPDRRD